MSAVVLRCPNCGTTQGVQGECEACHEAQVRYYCGNHTPGRWLDGKVCSHCGAVYGRTVTRPVSPPPSRPPPAAPTSPRREPPEIGPSPREARSRGWTGPWSRRAPPAPADELDRAREEEAARARALERLHDLLRGADERRRTSLDLGLPTMLIHVGGCLRLAVWIFLFLLVSFFALTFLGSLMFFSF